MCACHVYFTITYLLTWASAHRGKWGQLTSLDEILKSENMQKRAVFWIFWEQSGQEGVENGAMLTTYLFRHTSEYTISWSNFPNFLRLRRQGGIDPLTKILRTSLITYWARTFAKADGQTENIMPPALDTGVNNKKYELSVGALHPGLQCWHAPASAFRQPSPTCRTAFPAQHLQPSGVLSCWPDGLELTPVFYPRSNEQHRLF